MDLGTAIKKFGLDKAIKYLQKDPETNMEKLMDAADFVAGERFPRQRKLIREAIEDKNNPYHQYLLNIIKGTDEQLLRTFISNFVFNAVLLGWPVQIEARKKYKCNVPFAILLDPTSACNLHCTGCWAAEYGNKLNLSIDEIDSIIRQGKELGVYFYIYTGGEPMVRKNDIIKLCEMHPDCIFLAFTNGTLIDEKFADDMLRVKNFVPAISLEGFEEATDGRRGDGVYDKVVAAMKVLHEKRLVFGISACYTKANFESITSEEFYNYLIETGAYFIWYFHYMPVGNDADVSLLPTPEQREAMYYRLREYRRTKPFFAMDFQNDAENVGGCIAGGRRYLHINANGDVDPCVFVHYSDSNIREKSLIECLQSPLFMAYHDGQPFNDNMLKPCPMLENPGKINKIIHETGAKSTDLASPEDVDHLTAKCEPYAENWTPKAEELWAKFPKAPQTNPESIH